MCLGPPDGAIRWHQRSSLALWLTLLGCSLLVAATATSQEVESTPTPPEVQPIPKSPEAEPTPISPEVEPTTIPEAETVAPEVSQPEGGAAGAPDLTEEVGEPVALVPTTEAGGGARWRIAPHIQAKVTYDDNIFIQPSHERGDFIFTLAPGITFGYWELEQGRDDLRWQDAGSLIEGLRGNFLIVDYTAFLLGFVRTSSQDTLDHEGRVAFHWELAKLTLSAALDAASKTEANPDVGQRVRVRSLAINITSRYQVSDKTLLGLTLSNTINDPDGFIQTTEWRSEGFAQYAITPLLQLGLGLAGGRLQVEEGSDQAFEQILARAEYSLTDKLAARFSGGVEFRQFDESNNDRTSPVFALGIDWRPAAATEVTLQAFRQVGASALNVGENITTTGFEANFRRTLRGGLQFSLAGGYHVVSYTFAGGGETRTDHYVFVRPGLSYRITDRLQAGLTYQYRRNESSLQRFQFSNNQVTAEITLQF
jgi:Putative beta-barrel porin 2